MQKITAVVALALIPLFLSLAQEKMEPQKTSHKMTGYMVDQMCGKKMVMSDIKKSNAKAARHTKDCLLEESCKTSGYGLVTGGKYYKFDKSGDQKALDYLNSTKKEDNIKVDVTGTMDGNSINVESIKDFSSKIKAKGTKT